MRVLLARNAYSWQFGGAEKFTYNLASELLSLGVTPIVATRVPELLKSCHEVGIQTFRNLWLFNGNRRIYLVFYYSLYPFLVAQYLHMLLRYKIDVAVCGSRDDQIFVTIAAKIARKPVVFVDHADMKDTLGKLRLLRWSYDWALHHASKIIAVSRAELDKLSRNLPAGMEKKFVVINNGAVRGKGKALPRPRNIKLVSFIGRIEQDKGVFDLVEAASFVLKGQPDIAFWLAGKGRDETKLNAKIRELGLDTRFKLIGHQDNVWPLLLASDLFVYPTHHDASPLAPVEAMLAKVPVVATDVGGLPEIIDNMSGILVPSRDPSALADAILQFFSDGQLRKKLKAGATKRGEELEFGRVVSDHYLPLLEEVTG